MQPGTKVLLIERGSDTSPNVIDMLQWTGYAVITAENGRKGLELARTYKPDIIVCDILLPDLDGYSVLHMLQGNEDMHSIPFIFLTSKADVSEFRKGMEMGADDYIVKPYHVLDLLSAMEVRLRKYNIRNKGSLSQPAAVRDIIRDAAETIRTIHENRDIDIFLRKTIIYPEGNHPLRLYYIRKGKVRTYKRNEDGRELSVELYNAGEFLGYVAMLEGTVYKDTAEAMEETEVAVIPKEDFERLISRNYMVASQFMSMLAKKVTEKNEQLLALAYNSLRKKVAGALIYMWRKYNPDNDPDFSIDISREGLAAIAGTATESLIRTLGHFRDEQLVQIRNGSIIVLNEDRLSKLIDVLGMAGSKREKKQECPKSVTHEKDHRSC